MAKSCTYTSGVLRATRCITIPGFIRCHIRFDLVEVSTCEGLKVYSCSRFVPTSLHVDLAL